MVQASVILMIKVFFFIYLRNDIGNDVFLNAEKFVIFKSDKGTKFTWNTHTYHLVEELGRDFISRSNVSLSIIFVFIDSGRQLRNDSLVTEWLWINKSEFDIRRVGEGKY